MHKPKNIVEALILLAFLLFVLGVHVWIAVKEFAH